MGTEEPPPSHSTEFNQGGGSRQAPVIPCQWCGGLAPLTEVSVRNSQGSARTGTGMLGLVGESGMGGTSDSSGCDFLCSDLGWLSAAHSVSLPPSSGDSLDLIC